MQPHSNDHIVASSLPAREFKFQLWKGYYYLIVFHQLQTHFPNNKTKRLGSFKPTCEHSRHCSRVSYMFPLLTFLLCFICFVHIERCPWSDSRQFVQVPTKFYDAQTRHWFWFDKFVSQMIWLWSKEHVSKSKVSCFSLRSSFFATKSMPFMA